MRTVRARQRVFALALALFAAGVEAAELGTLFHSAEERERLDKLRRGDVIEAPAGAFAPRSAPALTGFVQRSDGRNTVWIDGRPVGVLAPKGAPYLDPKSVRAYSSIPDAITVERKPAR